MNIYWTCTREVNVPPYQAQESRRRNVTESSKHQAEQLREIWHGMLLRKRLGDRVVIRVYHANILAGAWLANTFGAYPTQVNACVGKLRRELVSS